MKKIFIPLVLIILFIQTSFAENESGYVSNKAAEEKKAPSKFK